MFRVFISNRVILFLIMLCFASPAFGYSLWRDSGFGGKLFVDHRARNIGDAVTVKLSESTAASQIANTKMDNNSNLSVGPGTGFLTFGPNNSIANGVAEKDAFQGKGSTDRSSSLTGMISAQIKEVLPNGDYVIYGKKQTVINDETQIIEVSGTVRPEYIDLDNTIESSFIANAKIAFVGAGPVGDSQSPGLVTKLFGWLF